MANIPFFSRLPELSWQAQEVIKEINNRPHLLVRIEITGGYFPHRAAEPFVRIVAGRRVVASWFASVSDDNRRLAGYFPTDLPRTGAIELGYGTDVLGRPNAKFASTAIKRLDRKRLPSDVVVVSTKYLETKQQGSEHSSRRKK